MAIATNEQRDLFIKYYWNYEWRDLIEWIIALYDNDKFEQHINEIKKQLVIK